MPRPHHEEYTIVHKDLTSYLSLVTGYTLFMPAIIVTSTSYSQHYLLSYYYHIFSQYHFWFPFVTLYIIQSCFSWYNIHLCFYSFFSISLHIGIHELLIKNWAELLFSLYFMNIELLVQWSVIFMASQSADFYANFRGALSWYSALHIHG